MNLNGINSNAIKDALKKERPKVQKVSGNIKTKYS
jgi:hypothetical protein